MMDSDQSDYGDDIADEDMVMAAMEATSPVRPAPSNRFQSQEMPAPARVASTYQRPRTVIPSRDRTTAQAAPRQTTLFGQFAQSCQKPMPSSSNRNRVYRADRPPEEPTHHDLDLEALETWVYPTNLGPTRDYQFSITKNGLFHNTLVALPTGLGKTFIAATVMLNYFRWMPKAKLVFVAPTKPLVSQQIGACFNIAGIPRSQTTLLTGEVSPALRAEEWESKRVFFMTPQTLENDLSNGHADPKSIALLVIDEAHRATGNYSYVKVVSFIRRFSSSFRILALTATPGSKVESVQEVIDGLGISHVEIRTENSIDIQRYVHQRDDDVYILDPSDEMNRIKELFSEALKPLVDILNQQNCYYSRDPMSITTYGLVKAQKDWSQGPGRNANQGLKFKMMAIFGILAKLAHAVKLLNFHGIKPFFDNVREFRDETEARGQKGSKNKQEIVNHESFKKMMDSIDRWLRIDSFVGHPKLTQLSETILNHFMDAKDRQRRERNAASRTSVIVFSEYRDSAEEIVRVLNTHRPLIRAEVFVGQASSKRSEGMKQSEQIDRIQKFKDDEFNVLVATSIGEEGLDIGQVDLIVCYDASASPIRMLQRMGRTGRKRAGRAVLLLMRGKEEAKFAESKDSYEKMQQMICDGDRFNFRDDLSKRIIPRNAQPEVDMRVVDIPIENTQEQGLPEPRKRQPKKKKPAKKFHMPDGVETGFQSVASMMGNAAEPKKKARKVLKEENEVADIPELGKVVLRKPEDEELNRVYKNLPYKRRDAMEYIEQVDVTAHPLAQRVRQKTTFVKHGVFTKRCVRLFQTLAASQSCRDNLDRQVDRSRYNKLPLPPFGSDSESSADDAPPPPKRRKVDFPLFPGESDIPTYGSSDCDELEDSATLPAPARSNKAASKHTSRHTSRPVDSDENTETETRATLPKRVTHTKAVTKPKKSTSKVAGQPKRPRGKKAKGNAASAFYDESADEGDDCRRTSDLDLTDDSDDGADLEGFVVGDDVATSSNFVTSSIQRRSTSPTSPVSIPSSPASLPVQSKSKSQKAKPYYEPVSFDVDRESSGDDLPTMSQFIRDSRGPGASSAKHSRADVEEDSSDEDGGPLKRGRGPQKRRRNIMVDDDSDD